MDIERILADLRSQRNQIDAAIQALEGESRRGRRRSPLKGRKRGPMSAAARKAISERMKQRWAERRKKKSAA